MIDFSSPVGRKIKRRLREEQTIWLTTVDAQITPQPRPVWFHWDGETLLIFSQPSAAKVRHGFVVDEILAELREGDYDLLVVGAHVARGLNRFLLDDVTAHLIEEATTPVLVVRG